MAEVIILAILIAASITDFKRQEVPSIIQFALLLVLPFIYVNENVWGILLALPFFVASVINGSMGGADWKVVGLLGLCLGLSKMFAVTVIGCIVFIVVGEILQIIKGKGKALFPFIPALTVGYIVTLALEVYVNWIK